MNTVKLYVFSIWKMYFYFIAIKNGTQIAEINVCQLCINDDALTCFTMVLQYLAFTGHKRRIIY